MVFHVTDMRVALLLAQDTSFDLKNGYLKCRLVNELFSIYLSFTDSEVVLKFQRCCSFFLQGVQKVQRFCSSKSNGDTNHFSCRRQFVVLFDFLLKHMMRLASFNVSQTHILRTEDHVQRDSGAYVMSQKQKAKGKRPCSLSRRS